MSTFIFCCLIDFKILKLMQKIYIKLFVARLTINKASRLVVAVARAQMTRNISREYDETEVSIELFFLRFCRSRRFVLRSFESLLCSVLCSFFFKGGLKSCIVVAGYLLSYFVGLMVCVCGKTADGEVFGQRLGLEILKKMFSIFLSLQKYLCVVCCCCPKR
jgi:hypothetical protein